MPSCSTTAGAGETCDNRRVTWEPPSEVEEYRIVRAIGAGAMGVVYLAHDTLLDRPVAIKFISAVDIDARARERFFTEARAVARLSHPNVVAVYRVGEVRERPYLVSEHVRGTSLAATAKPMAWPRALNIAIGLARGLGAAHRRGVLHRDIKPANIMLGEDDQPKLLDFGLAKIIDGSTAHLFAVNAPLRRDSPSATSPRDPRAEATLSFADSVRSALGADAFATTRDASANQTREGAILGTPLYLAPELWRGASASQASDVYAIGMVLHELLAGHVPHAGVARDELVARVTTEDAAPIATRVADLPAQLAALVDACSDRDPSRRPGSGDALCELLQAVRVWSATVFAPASPGDAALAPKVNVVRAVCRSARLRSDQRDRPGGGRLRAAQ
jgi:serine/threonine protein kinase